MTTPKQGPTEFVFRYAAQDVYVSISPCCWMYPDYGLQLSVCLGDKPLPNIACEFLHDKRFVGCDGLAITEEMRLVLDDEQRKMLAGEGWATFLDLNVPMYREKSEDSK